MIVWGYLLFIAATLALAEAEDRFNHANTSRALLAWAEYLGLPIARAACILLFLVCAYPAMFGIASAPPLQVLMQGGRSRLTDLLFVLFMLGLMLPLLPGIRRLPAIVLPLATCIGVAVMFRWLLEALHHAPVALVPVARPLAVLLILWALGIAFALALAHLHALRGGRRDLRHLLLMWLQLPVPVVYALQLGAALRGASSPS